MFSLFKRKPRQPDMDFAAGAFYPIAAMRMHGIQNDFDAMNDRNTAALLVRGCTVEQARSAHWGGMSAIVQEANLFGSHVRRLRELAAKTGMRHNDVIGDEITLRYAAKILIDQILADAPDEYERYLRYIKA